MPDWPLPTSGRPKRGQGMSPFFTMYEDINDRLPSHPDLGKPYTPLPIVLPPAPLPKTEEIQPPPVPYHTRWVRVSSPGTGMITDAVSALMNLGVKRAEAIRRVTNAADQGTYEDVTELIAAAMKRS